MFMFEHLSHIPHFYMIRSVEAELLGRYIWSEEGPLLDMGCGDGSFVGALGLNEVYGIDIEENSVNTARQSKYYEKIFVASASNIPFPDGFFKVVFSNCALEHMDKLDTVLSEVFRVLAEGGKFIFTVPSKTFFDAIRNDFVLRQLHLNTGNALNEYNKIHHHVNIYDLEEWQRILPRFGFKILKCQYYLPGAIGRFVARMDMLYTVSTPSVKRLTEILEKRHRSLLGFPLRLSFTRYLKNPDNAASGTHLILKAVRL